MTIEFGSLPDVLLKPTETLTKLKKGANLVDGVKLMLIISAISGIIGLISNKLTLPMQLEQLRASGAIVRGYEWMFGDAYLVFSAILNLVVGLLMFLALAWLTAKLAKSISTGKGDVGRTAGLLSYVNAALSLFVFVPIAIVGLAIRLGTSGAIAAGPALMPVVLLAVIIAILFVLWVLLLAGRAASIANGSTYGGGIASVFLAFLILVGILIVIGIIIGIIMAIALYSGGGLATGHAIAGL